MATTSRIAWTDATFNPWMGCTKISPACDNCYAEVSTPARTLGVAWGAKEQRHRTSNQNWSLPVRWNRTPFWQCQSCGWRGEDRPALRGACPSCCSGGLAPARRRVFCASLADVFDNQVDPEWRSDLLDLIDRTPCLDWLLLTKRIGNVTKMLVDLLESEHRPDRRRFLHSWLNREPPENVWIGSTIVTQGEAERDLPALMRVPAAVRFVSMEPLLGPVDLTAVMTNSGIPHDYLRPGCVSGQDWPALDWVIVGGESGPHARVMDPEWAKSLRRQCDAAGVAHFFKQMGGNDQDKGGCLLDGVEIKQWPLAA